MRPDDGGDLARRIGLEALIANGPGARRIVVGMIDGPVDMSHPDLRDAEIRSIGPAADAACTVAESPACQHGTMVAGVLVASRSSRAPGLCPGCTLLVRPIFCEALDLESCPLVTPDHLSTALGEVMAAGARIVNMSVGLADSGARSSSSLRLAYDNARRKGVLLVAASGNHGTSNVNPLFDHPWVISVAAADPDGRVSSQSNQAGGVLAPGVDVMSTAPGGGYRSMTGTSMAAPFVTGALALLWSQWPEAAPEQLRRAILPVGAGRSGRSPPLLNAEAARQALERQLDRSTLQPSGEAADTMTETETAAEPIEAPPPRSIPDSQPTASAGVLAAVEPVSAEIEPQCGCGGHQTDCSCGGLQPADGSPSYIYAVGEIKPLFPSLGLQKEFEYAATQLGVAANDFYGVLSQDQYLYLAEMICWVMSIADQDVYFVKPRSQTELGDLISTLKPNTGSSQDPMSLVVGVRGPLAPAEYCSGLQLPIVLCNQLYYFDFDALFNTLKSQNIEATAIKAVMEVMNLKPNDGSTDADRALNYVAFRFPEIYQKADQLSNPNTSPGGVFKIIDISTTPSDIQSTRAVVDVIFKYQQVETQEQLFYYAGVDITGQFPFLSSPLRQYVPVS